MQQEPKMKLSNFNKTSLVCVMSFLISPIPNVALAESLMSQNVGMISTSSVLAEQTRASAEQDIQEFLLTSAELQKELLKQGLSADEVSQRLASLSEPEIRQLSSQVKEARAGGDILVAILIVVLIIYLIKRI